MLLSAPYSLTPYGLYHFTSHFTDCPPLLDSEGKTDVRKVAAESVKDAGAKVGNEIKTAK